MAHEFCTRKKSEKGRKDARFLYVPRHSISARHLRDCTNRIGGDNSNDLVEKTSTIHEFLLPKLATLTHLDLSYCRLSELPESFEVVTALQSFEASHNKLSSLPASIGHLKCLVKLTLSFNSLTDLPESFSKLDALETLDLSHNRFFLPPACFEVGCIKISSLDMSFNKLEEWKKGPMCGHALKFLNCAHNCLKANPDWLWGDFCRSLQNLNMSFNSFMNPSSMVKKYSLWRTGVTVGLQNLNLSNCGLNSYHMHLVYQLKALEKLNIGNISLKNRNSCGVIQTHGIFKSNFLWDLSFKEFNSCSLITELNICGVGLSSLPDDIDSLEALQIINCQENKIQWLPESFSRLTKLRIADFSHNKLLYLPKDFGDLVLLEELWLTSNQLSELPPTFSMLCNLKWLDLYDNDIEEFPLSLQEVLPSLFGLDIELNYFESSTAINGKFDSSLVNFERLKEVIRKCPPPGIARRADRSSGLKLRLDEDSFSENSESKCTDMGSSDLDSIEGDLRDEGENDIHIENEQAEDEEDWDLDDGHDDYFDPTCVESIYVPKLPCRALIINELFLRSDSFCPSDIHPSPTIRPNRDPFLSHEGQFDDA